MKSANVAATLLVILAGTLAAALPATHPPSPPLSFHELQSGETITVRLHSQGCFHDTVHHFHFLGGKSKLVTIFREDGRPQPKRLGTLPITDAEAAALDRLITFYRTCCGGCTTVDKITFVQIKADQSATRETFIDETCATMDEKTWPTNLWTLISRVTKKPGH